MNDKLKNEFFTEEQFQSLIHVPVDQITIDLNPYIYIDGVLSQPPFKDNYIKAYVVGFVSIKTEIPIDDQSNYIKNKDGSPITSYSLRCGDYCSRSDLNNIKDLMLPIEINIHEQQVYYNFSEFEKRCEVIGLPMKKKSEIKFIKSFNYDIKQINQLSNFTVKQAMLIASNWYFTNHVGFIPKPTEKQIQLQKHNSDVLCECIKGQNQQGFHLITKELWIKSVDDCYEEYSRQHPNGTQLVISSRLNIDLTTISKNEFIRWCKFMGIETGLTVDDDVENESIEFLKSEVERLQRLVWKSMPPPPQPAPQQAPKPPEILQKDEVKIDIRTTNKTIMVSLGLMAWMLSEKISKLSRADKPNRSAIEEAIRTAISDLNIINPDDDNHGIVVGNLNRDVSLGIKELKSVLKI